MCTTFNLSDIRLIIDRFQCINSFVFGLFIFGEIQGSYLLQIYYFIQEIRSWGAVLQCVAVFANTANVKENNVVEKIKACLVVANKDRRRFVIHYLIEVIVVFVFYFTIFCLKPVSHSFVIQLSKLQRSEVREN